MSVFPVVDGSSFKSTLIIEYQVQYNLVESSDAEAISLWPYFRISVFPYFRVFVYPYRSVYLIVCGPSFKSKLNIEYQV